MAPGTTSRDPRGRRIPTGGGSVTVTAPAKINLALRVGARRRDGYHALATLFQALDLADDLTLGPGAPGVRVTLTGPEAGGVPAGDDNLAVRALHLLAGRVGHDLDADGLELHLHKRIPAAAGLAGGSADAAAALVAGDAYWRTRLPRAELVELAAALGADVPFSLTGGTAVGTGRGDVLAPALARGRFHWVLAFADHRLSTPSVFAELDRLRGPAGPGGLPAGRSPFIGSPARAGGPSSAGSTRVDRTDVDRTHVDSTHVESTHVDSTHVDGSDVGGTVVRGVGTGGPTGPSAGDLTGHPAGRGRGVRVLPPPVEPVLPAGVLAAVRAGDPAALGRALVNDLQPAAVSLAPGLLRCLDAGVEAGALGAVLCGSGPTCAFLAADHEAAVALAAALAGTGVARSFHPVSAPAAGARVLSRRS